jgi:hypothetical protein
MTGTRFLCARTFARFLLSPVARRREGRAQLQTSIEQEQKGIFQS